MSNQHKNPTISFRITDAERKQIEARILASGMMKKDYFIRSCIYNRICVVGKKETIYPLVQTVNAFYLQLLEMQKAFTSSDCTPDTLPSSEAIRPFVIILVSIAFSAHIFSNRIAPFIVELGLLKNHIFNLFRQFP